MLCVINLLILPNWGHFTIYLNYKSSREYKSFLYCVYGCFLFIYIYEFEYYLQNVCFAILNIMFFCVSSIAG